MVKTTILLVPESVTNSQVAHIDSRVVYTSMINISLLGSIEFDCLDQNNQKGYVSLN